MSTAFPLIMALPILLALLPFPALVSSSFSPSPTAPFLKQEPLKLVVTERDIIRPTDPAETASSFLTEVTLTPLLGVFTDLGDDAATAAPTLLSVTPPVTSDADLDQEVVVTERSRWKPNTDTTPDPVIKVSN